MFQRTCTIATFFLSFCTAAGDTEEVLQPWEELYTDVFEASRCQPVIVLPDDATCGDGETVYYKGSIRECRSDCARRHPRSREEDKLITSPGYSIGGRHCRAQHEETQDTGNVSNFCSVHWPEHEVLDEETYVMWLKPLEDEGNR